MSGIRSLYRGPTVKGSPSGASAPIYVDSDDNKVKVIPAGSGSTEVEVFAQAAFAVITGDGAVPIVSGFTLLTKGSAAAITVAAPTAAQVGTKLVITTGTDFAHVVTFTGSTLYDGTTGANITWTAAAFAGSSITVVATALNKWNVESFNLGTIA